MKIKLTAANESKVDAALTRVNGKYRERCAVVGDVYGLMRNAEKHLDKYGIPKAARVGTRIRAHEGIGCNSYEYRATATEYVIEAGHAGYWFLVGVARVQINTSRGSKSDWMTLGDKAKAWIAEKMPARIERDF